MFRITKSNGEYIIYDMDYYIPEPVILSSSNLQDLKDMVDSIYADIIRYPDVVENSKYEYDEEDEYMYVDSEEVVPVDELFK